MSFAKHLVRWRCMSLLLRNNNATITLRYCYVKKEKIFPFSQRGDTQPTTTMTFYLHLQDVGNRVTLKPYLSPKMKYIKFPPKLGMH
jgi:hypothetical protein